MLMNRSALVVLAALATLGLACGPKKAPPTAQAAPAPGAGPGTLSAHGSAPTPMGPSDRPSGGMVYTLPQGWSEQPVTSSMRLAQGQIPGAAGPGEFAIFYFGPGQGGDTESNLARWVSQVEPTSEPVRDSFESNGLKITWIEVAGTLQATGMGMGPTSPQPGGRLFAAVVEGAGGPWFLKVIGPDSTLAAERGKFLAMLKGMRLSSGS